MRMTILAAAVLMSGAAVADTKHFPDATETDDQLIQFYQLADTHCRHVNKDDVRTTVGCVSRAIYGMALNERGKCLGKEGDANASMQWHDCEESSLRFEPIEIPEIEPNAPDPS